jgi:hypothetical protein
MRLVALELGADSATAVFVAQKRRVVRIATPSLWWSGGLWPLGLDSLESLGGAQIESPRQGGVRCINTPTVNDAPRPIRREFENGPTSM